MGPLSNFQYDCRTLSTSCTSIFIYALLSCPSQMCRAPILSFWHAGTLWDSCVHDGVLAATTGASFNLFMLCGFVGWLLHTGRIPNDTAPVLSKVGISKLMCHLQLYFMSLILHLDVLKLPSSEQPYLSQMQGLKSLAWGFGRWPSMCSYHACSFQRWRQRWPHSQTSPSSPSLWWLCCRYFYYQSLSQS